MAESCVQWKVWMRNSRETACEDAGPPNRSSPSTWLHCHHWEPHPAFPGLCQERMGADFVTASVGTGSQFPGGRSEWRPGFDCQTEAVAKMAPGTVAGPIVGFLDLCPYCQTSPHSQHPPPSPAAACSKHFSSLRGTRPYL